MITGLKWGVSFNSLHFLMMPIFKRKIIHSNWVAFQSRRPQGSSVSPNSPKTSDMKYSRLAVYILSFDDTNFVTYQSLINWGCNFEPLQRQRKPSGLAVSQVAMSSWWSLPGHSVHPQQGSASVQIHKAASRFWLCNYLFSYNCRFSCIIRLINIKLFLMLSRILNDAVRSQKEGKWYPEKWEGEKRRALPGQGQDTQRLCAWCTLQTQNTSDCHNLASYTARAPSQEQTNFS